MTQNRDEWRWTDEQGVQRLVRTEELRAAIASQVLPDSVLVWREGMEGWVPAFSVPELATAARLPAEPRFGGTIPDGAPIPDEPDKRPPMATLLGVDGPSSRDGARLAAAQGWQADRGALGRELGVCARRLADHLAT